MKCSVAGCGLCQSKNRPNLTFHRLPVNESRRSEWLKNIGLENIRPGTKNIYVCSLHFEESAFNKTLNIVKLRDDAVPTVFAKADHPSQFALIDRANAVDQPSLGYSHTQNKNLELADHPSQFSFIDTANTVDQPSCSGYSNPQDAKDLELASALQELKKLEEKVEKQKKIIKCLNEVVRQQKLKLYHIHLGVRAHVNKRNKVSQTLISIFLIVENIFPASVLIAYN